jgi:UDP-2,4-diacetamido-2,4,6-trideoxy-beta-L-altropyranose hydrolase
LILAAIKKRIVFRCDASTEQGFGHFKRCLSIAAQLPPEINLVFASGSTMVAEMIPFPQISLVAKEKLESEELFCLRIATEFKPRVMIFDKKYNYSRNLFTQIKELHINVIVVDHLCDGLELADEIIIPGAFIDPRIFTPYLSQGKIDQVKMGSDYIILNPELPEKSLLHPKKFKEDPNIIVTTGGTDPSGVMLKLIPMIKKLGIGFPVHFLVGEHFKFKAELELLLENAGNFDIVPFSINNLSSADIAITAFGVTLYELLYLGTPTLCIAHDQNNANSSQRLNEKFPYFTHLGVVNKVDSSQFKTGLENLLYNKSHYNQVARHCFHLTDGLGSKRISQLILKHAG